MRPESHPDAFPVNPPADPDDPATVAAHDWTAFEQLSEVTDHWRRPGWQPGSRAYYWLLTMPITEFGDQVFRLRSAISRLPYDPIPDDGIHLTLGRIGDTENASLRAVRGLLEGARIGLPTAFDLTAIPITASKGAIRYSVAPWTPLLALHAHLAQATAAAGLGPMKPSRHLRPHIGVAYSFRRWPATEVRTVLEPLRILPPSTLHVTKVDLVLMRRETGAYRWDPLAELPLPHP
ncbi:2'-5' RNA ligase family protein [Streptomyces sp. NPDC047024]|uniref:2'-5' RNA ligase family protein n=1 Tax=Streptomyces sp. NPDC047024 TaxID=3155476 RepID=UPI0033D9F8A6